MRKNFINVLVMLFFVLGLSMFISCNAEAALKECNETTNIKYDLDGDGKKENIQFQFSPGDEYYDTGFSHINIIINNKIKKLSFKGWPSVFSVVKYKFLKLKNGKRFLYLNPVVEDNAGPRLIYQYKAGKLKKVYNLDELSRWVKDIKVQNNSIRVLFEDDGGKIGHNTFWAKYNYKNKKFVLDGKIYIIDGYSLHGVLGKKPVKVLRSLPVYSDKKCKKYFGTIEEGEYVRADKVYIITDMTSYHISNGKIKGWIKDERDNDNPHLENEHEGIG